MCNEIAIEFVSTIAWGNQRDPQTWTGSTISGPMFDRGFTGHEHLFSFGLINMNGRMYDPVMSSFLSVDNYVQSPENSQNFNRYAYCLNNPLKYTDPSGEELCTLAAVGIYVAISAAINVVTNGIQNTKDGVGFFVGAGKVAVVGAAQGFFSYGIGEVAGAVNLLGSKMAGPVFGKISQASFQVLAHGTVGGVSTMSRGGDFWAGFASGAVSSAISSITAGICEVKINSKEWTAAITIAAGGLSGGITSTMAGGDFWDGLCNGLICAGLNHAMHLVAEGGSPDDPPEKNGSGLGKAAAGAGAATASELYYSEKYKTWMGKNFKIYKQTWGGNGATGGKLKFASRMSKWFDGIGKGLGAHNAYQIYKDYRNGDINFSTMAIEEISNTISTLGGVEGAAWGIGWELGRCVTETDWYQQMKFNIEYNQFEKQFGAPSPSNEQQWHELFYQGR